MKSIVEQNNTLHFSSKLASYKQQIDQDLTGYSNSLVSDAGEHFGQYSAESMKVFCDVLSRGGKRVRGALTMLAYEMYGGRDKKVAIEAARAMEIVQTYLLIVDDIYDRSQTRRGKASAHVMFADIHSKNHWKADSSHFGQSIAYNTGLIGCHLAMSIIASLDVEPSIALKATKLLNDNLVITGEGQANDVFNEVIETTSRESVENVLVWKTAYYTFVNPLQFGATLAGAGDDELERIRDYSLAAGRTFQITDDILGTFGSEFESGKSPMDDIREGKRTLLAVHALEHAAKPDAYFLQSMLGNHKLTQAEFKKCKDIIFNAGSLDYAKNEAQKSCDEALGYIDTYWSKDFPQYAEFLKELTQFLLVRKS